MDSFPFHDIRVEKANVTSRYRQLQRITTLIRLVEVFVFMIVVSRFSSQFALTLKGSGEYFKGITLTLISPRFVFLLGNAIIIVLFLKSGRFSAKSGEKTVDFYDEYAEKCRKTKSHQNLEEKKGSGAEGRKIVRCRSENLERERRQEDECRRDLRRSVTELRQESTDCRRRLAAEKCSYAEDEMSNEEFRRTVEAFIARQQRFLREE
ncbi:hypothetical protein PHJA_001797900 [Phtheirospermum japonicum]|uniref:DUF4408 domain-containing protein n=1 Tax=Phtheirospermum japonicum TaxID=374723 RepID=A0A830CHF2_9LAMI|nr:hypothetical protein PHJA_001797900 [Phtheirospermum japonicum]